MQRKRSKSISKEIFTSTALILLLSLTLMGGVLCALSMAYFSQERRTALTSVLDASTALSNRFAAMGRDITKPIADDELRESIENGFELFHTSSDVTVFVADETGHTILNTETDALTATPVPEDVLDVLDAGEDYFEQGTLDGTLTTKHYVAGRRIDGGQAVAYLFVCTSTQSTYRYLEDSLSVICISAICILLLAMIVSMLLTRKITAPIEQISAAARQLGSGDFTARAPVNGCEELAEFATTFNNMAARLQTIDNARGQFMGNIAHELRTPMTSIKGFIDGMLDDTIPESEYKHYLAIVSQETGRLARLVQNMLDITKLESGEYKVQARSFNVWDTLTDVVLSDERRIEDGRIDIQGLEPGREPVFADPDLVHQVVYNIVDNAIKFTPPDGVIRFQVVHSSGMVYVSIENTGDGIAPEALPFVFERFYKEDRSRGLNTRGSGLGLHICKVLVNLSGGQIKAESEQGKWCRFTFSLPAADPRQPAGR